LPDVHTFELQKSNDDLVVNGHLSLRIIIGNSTVSPIPLSNALADLFGTVNISQQPSNTSSSQWPTTGFNTQSDELRPLPPNWERRQDPLGKNYYVDRVTQMTTWYLPFSNPAANTTGPRVARQQSSAAPTPAPTADGAGALPAGWEERRTPEGRVYYVDRKLEFSPCRDHRLTSSCRQLKNDNVGRSETQEATCSW
jgi:hypothetical protein